MNLFCQRIRLFVNVLSSSLLVISDGFFFLRALCQSPESSITIRYCACVYDNLGIWNLIIYLQESHCHEADKKCTQLDHQNRYIKVFSLKGISIVDNEQKNQ